MSNTAAASAETAFGPEGNTSLNIGHKDSILTVVDIVSGIDDGADGKDLKAPAWTPSFEGDEDAPTSKDSALIVKSIIDLAHGLGLTVTAEGVETEEQLKLLRDLGCDVAQGYFVAEPLPPEELISWLDRFEDYPIRAWDREGGDAKHTNFVNHFRVDEKGKKKGDVWNTAIKAHREKVILPALRSQLARLRDEAAGQLVGFGVSGKNAAAVHAEALAVCRSKARDFRLDIKIVRCEYNFDGGRLLIYFSSEERVDFRSLVRELARIFRTRIEMRQIGVRDEAKLLDGVGKCGRQLCCTPPGFRVSWT